MSKKDVLAYAGFPPARRAKVHATTPLERRTGEIEWRTHLFSIFLNEAAIAGPTGTTLLEQND